MADLYQNLRPASFRGISFDVPEDSTNFGRRVQTHEYPGKDEPGHEDTGQTPQSFNLTAVITGPDFYSKAKTFEDALKQIGPGKLIHPYYGEMDVVVKSNVTRSHSTQNIGEITFRIEFEKYGKPVFPQPVKNTAVNISLTSNALFDSAEADFISRFTGSGVPDFITDDAVSRLNSFTDNVKAILGVSSFLPSLEWPPASWQLGNASTLAASLTDLYKTIAGAVKKENSPMIGGTGVKKSVTPANVISLARSLTSAAGYSVALDGSQNTDRRAVRLQNASSLDLIQRSSAISAAGNVLQRATYESREQAISVRDGFATAAEALINDLGQAAWDSTWSASRNLLAAVTKDINSRIGRLPKTTRIKNTNLRPSMALANRLYGGQPETLFSRAADIANRNTVRHPGFIPATELEVLL